MTIYPGDALAKLGYDRIRQHLAGLCRTEGAQALSLALMPGTNEKKIKLSLARAEEMLTLVRGGYKLPLPKVPHIAPLLARIKADGVYLAEAELMQVLVFLRTAQELQLALQKYAEDC